MRPLLKKNTIFAAFKYLIEPAYLYVMRKKELLEVPIEACTNWLAFSFTHTGWHYFIETLKEYDKNKTIHFKDTTLYKFYQFYQYEDMFNLLCCNYNYNNVKFKPNFGIYPWGSFTAESHYNGGVPKNRFTSHLCGPTEDPLIERVYNNLINLYNEIQINGYRPWSKGFIEGTMLERKNGEQKLVVLQGNHRTAVMSHLGFKKILARYKPLAFRVIREKDVLDWYYVRNGECSKKDALYYFDLFFKLDGSERALALGLKK